ncbi:SMC family ATPase [Candidatus Woesearchaeota archaeon]|nr:SMC family ATPase [Candidatus Woesearchaeota archaeon]
MILRWLRLENIRSYVHEEIIFPEGSVLLSGDIGSGKTTILLAIEFALFGFNKNDLTGDSLLRHGKHEGNIELCFDIEQKKIVIKRFLRRSNAVKQEHGYIMINNERIDCTAVELKTKILELIGYPSSLVSKSRDVLFRYTVYTPQDAMKMILQEDKEYRLETLRKLFAIDKYKRVRENLQVVIKDYKTQRLLYEQHVQDFSEKQNLLQQSITKKSSIVAEIVILKKKLKEITDAILLQNAAIEQSLQMINEQKKLANEIIVEKEKLNNLNNLIKKDKQHLLETTQQLIDLEKKKNEIKIEKITEKSKDEIIQEIKNDEIKLMQIKEQLIKLQQQQEFAEKRLLYANNEIEKYKQQVVSFDQKKEKRNALQKSIEQKEQLQDEIAVREQMLQKSTLQLSEIETTTAITKTSIENIKSINMCFTCLQTISDEYKERISLDAEQKKKNLSEKKEAALQQKAKNQESLGKLQERMKQLLIEEKESILLNQEIKQLKEKIIILHEKEKEVMQIEKEKIELKSLIEQILGSKILDERISDGNIYRGNNITENKMAYLEKKILDNNKLLELARKYDQSLQELQLISAMVIEKQLFVSRTNELLQQYNLQEKELHLSIEQKQLLIKDIDKLNNEFLDKKQLLEKTILDEKIVSSQLTKQTTEAQYLDKEIEKINKEIEDKNKIKDKIAALNNLINWLADKFTPLTILLEKQIMLTIYREFNECFITWFTTLMDDESVTIRLDEDFTPVIHQNGYDTNFEYLSGGEKTAVALAYRLALNKVVNDYVSTVMTKDIIILDEPTEGFSYEQLDKMKDVLDQINVKQVIIVSHEAKIESFVQNIIRLNKSGHVSKVVS